MGIRFNCPNGHHLHVKSFLAGKRGICPHCQARFEIPFADTGRVEAYATRGTGAAVQTRTARWYVRPATGGQFGPASDDVMHQWIGEMRVTPEALVWRDDWAEWRRASEVFAELQVGKGARLAAPDFPELAGGGDLASVGRRSAYSPAAAPTEHEKIKRLVLLLGGVVLLLAAGLVFVIFYIGQG